MRAAIFLLAFLPGAAHAAEEPRLRIAACEDSEQLSRRILSCTDNALAEKAAKACGEALAGEWKKANATLTRLMRNKADGAQKAQLGQANADLAFSIAELDALILATESAADNLARYPRIMFDNPYAGPSLQGSSNCYKGPFQAIAKVVKDLDEKADEGQDALVATERLGGQTVTRVASLGGGDAPPVATGRAVRAASAPAVLPRDRVSEVTGVHESEAKELSAPVPRPVNTAATN